MRDDTLSELAALKQDAKDFGWRQMAHEREKRATLEPLYRIAKTLLPKLAISQQNLHYYASLANFYTVYDLRNLKAEQTHLYLLCYAWQRYRQFTDNLVDALAYHMKQFEDESKARAHKQSSSPSRYDVSRKRRKSGACCCSMSTTAVADATPFGDVRQRAYKIMPRDVLQSTAQRMSMKPASKLALRWQVVDGLAERIRRHLRPLYVALDFARVAPGQPVARGAAWAKGVFAKQQRLSQRPLAECPDGHPTEAFAAVSADVRCGREADGRACRPLRVLAIPPDQEAPQVGRNLPGRQPAAPLLHRRTGLAGREGRRAQPDGHPFAAPADRRPARRADGRTARRSGWRSIAS